MARKPLDFYGTVRAVKEGQIKPEALRPGVRGKIERAAASMTRESLRDLTAVRDGGQKRHAFGESDGHPRNARSA